jgi:hypothetical protein
VVGAVLAEASEVGGGSVEVVPPVVHAVTANITIRT